MLFAQAISAAAEKDDIKKRWDALYNEFFVVLGYLPLTIHWCVLLPYLPTLCPPALGSMPCVDLACLGPYAHFVAMQLARTVTS